MKRGIIFFSIAAVLCSSAEVLAETNDFLKPITKFLHNIEYTSRVKLESDDNIFLTKNNKTSDVKTIFSQSLAYKKPADNSYFELNYTGNYSYYTEESLNLLSHNAGVLYSYRPFDEFSIGFRDDYSWLSDSKAVTTLGDRILGLGYIQNVPSLEMKYEFNPRAIFEAETYYQLLNVRNAGNDDYIDNKRLGAKTKLTYDLTYQNEWLGFVGTGFEQVKFPQTFEKSSNAARPFLGITKKFANIANVTQEIGFQTTRMDDNSDDVNTDFKTILETVFSIYTKLRLSFDVHAKTPSLRREYSQYDSNAVNLNLSRILDSKTTALLDYSFEKQHFNAPDHLAGQADINKDTRIQNLGLTLSRKLKGWLTMECRYDYTKRDTNFAGEGYIDNKFSIGLAAKY